MQIVMHGVIFAAEKLTILSGTVPRTGSHRMRHCIGILPGYSRPTVFVAKVSPMKSRDEVRPIMQEIMAPNSPVGMDPVYVHALILDKLTDIQRRLEKLEAQAVDTGGSPVSNDANGRG
jgi:hypothetical protein